MRYVSQDFLVTVGFGRCSGQLYDLRVIYECTVGLILFWSIFFDIFSVISFYCNAEVRCKIFDSMT